MTTHLFRTWSTLLKVKEICGPIIAKEDKAKILALEAMPLKSGLQCSWDLYQDWDFNLKSALREEEARPELGGGRGCVPFGEVSKKQGQVARKRASGRRQRLKHKRRNSIDDHC